MVSTTIFSSTLLQQNGSAIPTAPLSVRNRERLREKALRARDQAQEARRIMERARDTLRDLAAGARLDPSYANLVALREAGEIYGKAVADFLSEQWLAEKAANIAGNNGILILNREAGTKTISPGLEQMRADIKTAEAHYREVEKAARLPAAGNDFMGRIEARAELQASLHATELLYDLARQPFSTEQDADRLLESLVQLKQARKTEYVSRREERIGVLVQSGKTEAAARREFARELRAERREEDGNGSRKTRIAREKKMRVFGGDLKEACRGLDPAIQAHSQAKSEKKSAAYARDMARKSGDMGGLQNALAEQNRASTRMALAILRELTYQNVRANGITKIEARQMARDQFKAEHERRVGLKAEQKKQLRREGKLGFLEIGENMPREMAEWRLRWNKRVEDVRRVKESGVVPELGPMRRHSAGRELPSHHRTVITDGAARQKLITMQMAYTR